MFTLTTSPQRSGGHAIDDAAIGSRRGVDGVLDQPGEAVADGVGVAAVEAEDELVEVALQVLGSDGAVVGAEQPALGEAEDEMDGGQPQAGIAPTGREVDRRVAVALALEAAIAGPAVGGDRERLGRVGGDEAFEARGRGIRDRLQPQPTEWPLPALAGLGLDRARRRRSCQRRRGPVLPGLAPPTSVSSTSTRFCRGSRSGRIVARRILCSQVQAVP